MKIGQTSSVAIVLVQDTTKMVTLYMLIDYPEWWEDLQKKKAATTAPVNRAGVKALMAADLTGNDEGREQSTCNIIVTKPKQGKEAS